MKKIITLTAVALLLSSCGGSKKTELTNGGTLIVEQKNVSCESEFPAGKYNLARAIKWDVPTKYCTVAGYIKMPSGAKKDYSAGSSCNSKNNKVGRPFGAFSNITCQHAFHFKK